MNLFQINPSSKTQATLTAYLHEPITQEAACREAYPAVIICPGGGYEMVSEREAEPVAMRYYSSGYQVFILRYSTGLLARDFRPLAELSLSIALIRENAQHWHVLPHQIALCGFSAGGHLAASSGVLWNHPEFTKAIKSYGDSKGLDLRPSAMILSYPVISADEFAHQGSIERVSGSEPGSVKYNFFSLEQHVDRHTPPTFIWHTVDDGSVPVENSLAFISMLQKHHISYEAHLFPHGKHGLSVATEEVGSPNPLIARWMDLSITWLNHLFDHNT